MPYTTIDTARIKRQALSILNACRTAYGTPSDEEWRPSAQIDDAIQTADGMVYDAVKNNPNHLLRRLFFEDITVTSGQVITDTPTGKVLIDSKEGTEVTLDVVRRYRENKLGLSSIAACGYYAWHENKSAISFLGSSATISVIKSMQGASPLTPAELESAVLAGVMMLVSPKEGDYIEMANHYSDIWQIALRVIGSAAGSGSLPEVSLPRL